MTPPDSADEGHFKGQLWSVIWYSGYVEEKKENSVRRGECMRRGPEVLDH